MLLSRINRRATSSASYSISPDFKSLTKYFQVSTTSIDEVKVVVFGRMQVSAFLLSKSQSAKNLSRDDPMLGSINRGPDSISGWHNLRSLQVFPGKRAPPSGFILACM